MAYRARSSAYLCAIIRNADCRLEAHIGVAQEWFAATPPSEQATPTMHDANYEVGFRRPPLHTRFKPGQSGSPSGRAKGSKNLKTLLHSILNVQIALQEGS